MTISSPAEAMDMIVKIARKSGIEPTDGDQEVLLGLCERFFYGSPQEKMKCLKEATQLLERDIGVDGVKLMKGISGPAKKEFGELQSSMFKATGISEGNPFA